MSVDGTRGTRLTNNEDNDWHPSWAPVPGTTESPGFGALVSIAGILSFMYLLKKTEIIVL